MASDETEEGTEPMDPVSAAGAMRLASQVGAPSGRLLERLLGPSVDVASEVMANRLSARLRGNTNRVVEIATSKPGFDQDGQVPPRVAFELLEQSGFADDEMMAEYLAGLLAASRTPDGRDDRAVVWSAMLSGMSAVQIRAHFLFYRVWSSALTDSDQNLWMPGERNRARLVIDMAHFVELLGGSDDDAAEVLSHALPGLVRLSLIEQPAWGSKDYLKLPKCPYDSSVIVTATPVGMELFGWAAGLAGMTPASFIDYKPVWADELPALTIFTVTDLSEFL